VLLLEAGENHDNDKVIANSADAWIGAWAGRGFGMDVDV
jgi:hypothetical protein